MDSTPHLRLGTRASALARWQAQWVAARLGEHGVAVTLVPISTAGDRDQRGPVERIGGQGVFTKEIQVALLEGRADLAVHSLKDLPTEATPGLALSAVPERASPADVLVSQRFDGFAALPDDAVIGTGSLRRRAQLLHARPRLRMREIRGNVDTRLQKLAAGEFDAIILAEAGLRRLGFADQITEVLPSAMVLPAVGQGALGLETRHDDEATRRAIGCLDHPATHAAVLAERALLRGLDGGCMAPIAAWGQVEGGVLRLVGRVLSHDGRRRIETSLAGEPAAAEALGARAAEELLAQGAAALIATSRAEAAPEPSDPR